MAAEGGKVLLQGLLITDVSEHRAAPRQFGGAAAGQKQSGSRHQGGQAEAFQRHSFAAGVGSSDRHHPQRRVDLQTDWHHRAALLAPLLPDQQGVAQVAQLPAVTTELWLDRSDPGAVARPG